MKLKLADTLSLPLDAVRSGKISGAKRIKPDETHVGAAQRLGISVSTVKRRRKEQETTRQQQPREPIPSLPPVAEQSAITRNRLTVDAVALNKVDNDEYEVVSSGVEGRSSALLGSSIGGANVEGR